MVPKMNSRLFAVCLSLILVVATVAVPTEVSATSLITSQSMPDLKTFIASVANGDAGVLAGVYVDGLFALPVIQQPGALAGYVSEEDNTLTQFDWPRIYGVVGLLAHNYLSGANFFQMSIGQKVVMIYGDGRVERYRVTAERRYRATEPFSVHSDFVDLDTDESLSAERLFNEIYKGARHVTFQTCIAKDGNPSWGRLFIIAEPQTSFAALLETSRSHPLFPDKGITLHEGVHAGGNHVR